MFICTGKNVIKYSKYCLFYKYYNPLSHKATCVTQESIKVFSVKNFERESWKRSGTISFLYPSPNPLHEPFLSLFSSQKGSQRQGSIVSITQPSLMDPIFHMAHLFCVHPACICKKHIRNNAYTVRTLNDC